MQLLLSVIVVLLWWFAGVGFLRFLKLKLTLAEFLATSWVIGFFVAMWATYLCSLFLGYGVGLAVAHAVLFAVGLLGMWKGFRTEYIPEPMPQKTWAKLCYLLFWVALVALTFSMAVSHFIQVDAAGNWLSAGYTWADLALHQTLAASFAHQPAVRLDLPIFAGTQLSYPFLTDFASSVVYRVAGDWSLAFVLPTLLSLLALLRLMVGVAWRILGSMRAAYIHLALILASGSAAGWWFFLSAWSEKGLSVAMKTDWTMTPERGLQVANLVTSHLLPQRTYLVGFLVFLVVVLLWQAQEVKLDRSRSIALALLYGGLPFVHVHTFLVVSLLTFLLIAWRLVKRKTVVEFTLPLVIGACVALPQLLWQLHTSYDASFAYPIHGWVTESSASVLEFWKLNWGVALGLMPLCFWLASRRRVAPTWLVPVGVAGVVLFVACNLYSFQPYAWDNMKFLTYSYYFLTLPVAYVLGSWLKRKRSMGVSFIFIFLLTSSGLLTVTREFGEQYTFLSKSEQDAGQLMLALLPADAVVLTSERHNHPVTMVAGRNLLVGYPGWLWSYGIEATPRLKAVKELWAGRSLSSGYVAEFGVTHAVLGPGESFETGYNEVAFAQYFDLIGEKNGWKIFAVKE
ncbi:hypothetical protein BH11PAT4_BH11PAT4_0740 [soil metagenome]